MIVNQRIHPPISIECAVEKNHFTTGTDMDVVRFDDAVSVESPLLIRYAHQDNADHPEDMVTLLRTPTNDVALAAGFMFSEGYVSHPKQLERMHFSPEGDAVTIIGSPKISLSKRHHITHSGCGSCALEKIDHLYQHLKPVQPWTPTDGLLFEITNDKPPQELFQKTGGTHAAVLYDAQGKFLGMDEDVGRHNALDKAIGQLWLNETLGNAKLAWVSGRIGFELVQKCINANISTIVAVGAPTSLSVDFAVKYGMNMIAFANPRRFNRYHTNATS